VLVTQRSFFRLVVIALAVASIGFVACGGVDSPDGGSGSTRQDGGRDNPPISGAP
jgi:hypothetical protein